MNAMREQNSAGRAAGQGELAVKASLEQSRSPVGVSTHQPVEVEAEYGCVDWYQYRVKVDAKETRH